MPHRLSSRDLRAIRASMSRDINRLRTKGNTDSAHALEEVLARVNDAIASLDSTPKNNKG
jgi:hypothetical protein